MTEGLPPSVPELLPPPVAPQPECAEVWVALTHHGWGESTDLLGVYVDREAAFRALKAMPNATVYTDEHGHVRARPKNENVSGSVWGHAYPVKVQG